MTVVLAFLKAYWSQVALGLALVGALVTAKLEASGRAFEHAQGEVYRQEAIGELAAFEGEKASTLAAVGAAQACAAESADQDKRLTAALQNAQANAVALRSQLAKCQTVGALIERFNGLDGDL